MSRFGVPYCRLFLLLVSMSACTTLSFAPPPPGEAFAFANRVTWGADDASLQLIETTGEDRFLERQLRPATALLPAAVREQIATFDISREPMPQLAIELENQRKAADAIASDDQRKSAQQTYRQHLNQLGRETATRALLRDLYSPRQLQEQMTWFWMNHFSVHQDKNGIRALLADYEDGIRDHALGRFRDLLEVSSHHPAMLVYLDNTQNARGHLNENYARELLELHTLGVDAGYSQRDVQELARILTGLGVSYAAQPPHLQRERQSQYRRQGLFEFNPDRHDYGDKVFLGQRIRGQGESEFEEVLDRLARHPATARRVCRELALFFDGDAPPKPLLDAMSNSYLASDGRIDEVLRTLFRSNAFRASLGKKFKDPVHYLVSAIRHAYDGKTVSNAAPLIDWLNRMGEPLYGHPTPEGYPLTEAAWSSPGQMNTRLDIAKTIASSSAGLFRRNAPATGERPAFPLLADAMFYRYQQPTLGAGTRNALDQAQSPQEWNLFLLSSPEFMYR